MRSTDFEDDDLLETILTAAGRLCLDDQGGWDYHGHSSGPAFLQGLRKRFLDKGATNGDDATILSPLQSVPWSPRSPPPPPEPRIAPPLPPKELAQKLVECALGSGCAVLSFIHRPTFSQLLDTFYETDPENYGIQEARSVDLRSNISMREGTKYFVAARSLIDISDCRELMSIQALLCLHRSLPGVFDAVEQETRKRVFWTVRNMEAYICAILGLPTAIKEDDVDQELPLEVDDACIARLMQIFAKILRYVYPVHHSGHGHGLADQPGEYRVKYKRMCEVEHELQLWSANLPLELSNDNDNTPNPLRFQRALLFIAYAHTRLILYRPFLLSVSHYTMKNQSDTRAHTYVMACLDASRDVIIGMRNMRERDILSGPFFFTSYSTFFAAISLISYAWERTQGEDIQAVLRYAEIGRDILSLLGQRSVAAARCSKALEALFGLLNKRLSETNEVAVTARPHAEPTLMHRGPESVTGTFTHNPSFTPGLKDVSGMGQSGSEHRPKTLSDKQCVPSTSFHSHEAGPVIPETHFPLGKRSNCEAPEVLPPSYMDSGILTAPESNFQHHPSRMPPTSSFMREQTQPHFCPRPASHLEDGNEVPEECEFTVGAGPSLNPATWPSFDLSRVETRNWGQVPFNGLPGHPPTDSFLAQIGPNSAMQESVVDQAQGFGDMGAPCDGRSNGMKWERRRRLRFPEPLVRFSVQAQIMQENRIPLKSRQKQSHAIRGHHALGGIFSCRLIQRKEAYFLGDAGVDGYISVADSTNPEFDTVKLTLEGLLVTTIRCLDWYADTLIQRAQKLLQLHDVKRATDFIGFEDQRKSTAKCFFHFDVPKCLQSELLGQNRGFLRDLPPSLPQFEVGQRHPVLQPRRQGQCDVTYTLRVQALMQDKVVTSWSRSIQIIPALDVSPPFCVTDFAGEYLLERSRRRRRWLPGGRTTGDLRIEACQPPPVILSQLTGDTVLSTTLSLTQGDRSTGNVREESRTPAQGRCRASLMFSTFISSDPRESAPTLKDLSSPGALCRNFGVYATVEVPVQFSKWTKTSATLQGDNHNLELEHQWKADAHVTLNFGKLKYPVPSFESSLVSRRYRVDLRVRIAAPYRCTLRLALPIQILYRTDSGQSPRRFREIDCPPYVA
ncbi:Fungal specific transcription factor domain-containing protein [Cladophialophora immunda]|nr:Fungal specific transcription factor domain-containing protein [Cladophialophora immunda]